MSLRRMLTAIRGRRSLWTLLRLLIIGIVTVTLLTLFRRAVRTSKLSSMLQLRNSEFQEVSAAHVVMADVFGHFGA